MQGIHASLKFAGDQQNEDLVNQNRNCTVWPESSALCMKERLCVTHRGGSIMLLWSFVQKQIAALQKIDNKVKGLEWPSPKSQRKPVENKSLKKCS